MNMRYGRFQCHGGYPRFIQSWMTILVLKAIEFWGSTILRTPLCMIKLDRTDVTSTGWCMHACMQYIHTYARTYIHTYINTYIHPSIHPSMHTYITSMHTYRQADRHTYIHIYENVGCYSMGIHWVYWGKDMIHIYIYMHGI